MLPMAWAVFFHKEALSKIKSLPLPIRKQFTDPIRRLGQDPIGNSHNPAMPFAWRGSQFDFRVTDAEGSGHNVSIFFLFDDDPRIERIWVHDVVVNPPIDD